MKVHAFAAFVMMCILAACSRGPSAEDKARIDALQAELKTLRSEIAAAQQASASQGGLLKALADVRVEHLRTTETLIQQRIHALESGAKVTVAVSASSADPKLAESLAQEITERQKELEKARLEAASSGGLIGVMKQMTVATQEQTLAMLESRRLAAKYGLPTIVPPSSPVPLEAGTSSRAEAPRRQQAARNAEEKLRSEILSVKLLRKQFSKSDYRDFVAFDIQYSATGLDKPARAIKGVLNLKDLFGESKMRLNWTIDEPIAPGKQLIERGSGFEFNQFKSEHQWVRSMELENMTATFDVQSILYTDGTRRDF
jgi:hypothetical protein